MTTVPQSALPQAMSLDELTSSSLQLIADSVTALVGFGVATISLAREDGNLHMAAVAGSDEAREQLAKSYTPTTVLDRELARADDWGLFKFVPAEQLDPKDVWGWVPDIALSDAANAWHPLDLLVAPLRDETGALLGTLSIDLPLDGLRPGPEKREVLNRYAEQSTRAILTALERERLAEQVRLAEQARALVRRATRHADMDDALAELADGLVAGYNVQGLWALMFDRPDKPFGTVYAGGLAPDAELVHLVRDAGVRLWEMQETAVIGVNQQRNVTSPEGVEEVIEFLRQHDYSGVLYAPMGAGQTCLGVLSLVRAADQPLWTDTECGALLDVGRDLGRLLHNADALRREQETARELRALDAYKSRLISTVSHELKNPLTAILGNLEILDEPDVSADLAERAFGSLDRSTRVMERLVDDLMTLSQVGDAEPAQHSREVDLVPLVRDACELVSVAADQRDLHVAVKAPLERLCTRGDAAQLDRVVVNLLSNAVKYTPEGGSVTVSLHRGADGLELTVADNGIGISAQDQERLFTEFFRSSDPAVLQQPGTGLGLAIVHRIVRRHGGTIRVESTLGRGTTVRVQLPEA